MRSGSASDSGNPDASIYADDGLLPDWATVFDDLPRIAGLDADLLNALRSVATAAADEGIVVVVNTEWRSAEHQQQQLHDAVATYGSEEEAARWVVTAETSPHVSGEAVDIGGVGATSWRSDVGQEFGQCQIHRNEP